MSRPGPSKGHFQRRRRVDAMPRQEAYEKNLATSVRRACNKFLREHDEELGIKRLDYGRGYQGKPGPKRITKTKLDLIAEDMGQS